MLLMLLLLLLQLLLLLLLQQELEAANQFYIFHLVIIDMSTIKKDNRKKITQGPQIVLFVGIGS